MNSAAIAVSGLWKPYGDKTILDGIDPTIGAVSYPMPRTEWLDRLARVMRYLRGDHAFAQLIRFALVGGFSNIAYILLFMAMNGFGPLVANIAGSIVSTVIANELHRQLTFYAAGRVGWFTAQWEGGGLALIGLLISTAALAGLEFWAPGLGEIAQAGAVIAVMAAVGVMRFLALRGFVFERRTDERVTPEAATVQLSPRVGSVGSQPISGTLTDFPDAAIRSVAGSALISTFRVPRRKGLTLTLRQGWSLVT
ncbi:GtrA family protein [Nocardia vinacea]|uniref:GtrA family protein n=1 Tax=Nocardia vinacea TaxID=96468 RepID=UPI003AF399D6